MCCTMATVVGSQWLGIDSQRFTLCVTLAMQGDVLSLELSLGSMCFQASEMATVANIYHLIVPGTIVRHCVPCHWARYKANRSNTWFISRWRVQGSGDMSFISAHHLDISSGESEISLHS